MEYEDVLKMDAIELKERVAAGLRAVSGIGYPIALLCANYFQTSLDSLCGVPIVTIGDLIHRPYADFDCPLFPIFKGSYDKDNQKQRMADWVFSREFLEYSIQKGIGNTSHNKQSAQSCLCDQCSINTGNKCVRV